MGLSYMTAPGLAHHDSSSRASKSRKAEKARRLSKNNHSDARRSAGKGSKRGAAQGPGKSNAVASKDGLICHGCGHRGHVRPDCPNKLAAGFRASGQVDTAISLSMSGRKA